MWGDKLADLLWPSLKHELTPLKAQAGGAWQREIVLPEQAAQNNTSLIKRVSKGSQRYIIRLIPAEVDGEAFVRSAKGRLCSDAERRDCLRFVFQWRRAQPEMQLVVCRRVRPSGLGWFSNWGWNVTILKGGKS